jgi:hypothetical protein
MILLHIEHSAPDFDAWKTSFDKYAELRQQSAMQRYRISGSVKYQGFTNWKR